MVKIDTEIAFGSYIESWNQKLCVDMPQNITSQMMKTYIEDIDLGICANELRFLMNLT